MKVRLRGGTAERHKYNAEQAAGVQCVASVIFAVEENPACRGAYSNTFAAANRSQSAVLSHMLLTREIRSRGYKLGCSQRLFAMLYRNLNSQRFAARRNGSFPRKQC